MPELDPLGFGNLAHEALCALGSDDDIKACDDPETIFRFLSHHLRRLVKDTYGERPLPAIMIQRARIEQRLRDFAGFQAASVREGWRIQHCEVDFSETVALQIPGEAPMPLRGKIDRIDTNIHDGRWRVIDYKTGERGDSPIRTHHNCKDKDLPAATNDLEWHDLQLPLYFLLVTQSEELRLPRERIELGYLVLPRQSDGCRWCGAAWTLAHLEHGIERARQIVREIRQSIANGAFEMNQDIDSPFDAFARICQTAAFRPLSGENGESEGGAGGGET
jgi:hypothetical protein